MKKLLKRLKCTRGEGYIDTVVSFFAIMMAFAFILAVAPIFIQKMTLNNIANELCREAEIAGRIGSETTTRYERLCETYEIQPNVTWSRSGRVPIGETFTVTVSTDCNFSFFVFQNTPITINSTAEGMSEVYWK